MRGMCSIVLIVSLVGCGVQDHPVKNTAEAKSSAEECPGCNECCAAKSRASMLQNSKETPPNELKPAEELSKEIEAQRGKVVCVFVWGSIDPKSIKHLPAVADLQQQFAKDGVVCLTACHTLPQTRELAGKLLDNTKSTLTSFVADEEATVAGEKVWQGLGLPAMIVFSRDGTKAASFGTSPNQAEFNLQAIEEAVAKTLRNQ